MPREHPDYRGNLETLNMMFPEKCMLTVKDLMAVLGCKSEGPVRRKFPIKDGKISKAQAARLMCN